MKMYLTEDMNFVNDIHGQMHKRLNIVQTCGKLDKFPSFQKVPTDKMFEHKPTLIRNLHNSLINLLCIVCYKSHPPMFHAVHFIRVGLHEYAVVK